MAYTVSSCSIHRSLASRQGGSTLGRFQTHRPLLARSSVKYTNRIVARTVNTDPNRKQSNDIQGKSVRVSTSSVGKSAASTSSIAAVETEAEEEELRARRAERMEKKKQQRLQYQAAAIAASSLITFTAISATFIRYSSFMGPGSSFPYFELFSSLACTVGAAVGMEFYARYAHKYLWHETWMWSLPEEWRKEWNKPWWKLHESHHEPREGAFENNDIFAIANAAPAFGLILYGFLTPGEFAGICFGTGLGITVFGMAYMFVHDGMIHKRFPVGPIEDLPYLKKIEAAHKIHHGEKYDGVPYGLFFAEDEMRKVPGGIEELEEVLRAAEARTKAMKERS